MRRFNHIYDVGFEVDTNEEEASAEEILEAMEKRLKHLKAYPGEVLEACGRCSTIESDDFPFQTIAALRDKSFYTLVLWGDTEPTVQGPFREKESRDNWARYCRKQYGDDNGIYWLDISLATFTVGPYSGKFFDDVHLF